MIGRDDFPVVTVGGDPMDLDPDHVPCSKTTIRLIFSSTGRWNANPPGRREAAAWGVEQMAVARVMPRSN